MSGIVLKNPKCPFQAEFDNAILNVTVNWVYTYKTCHLCFSLIESLLCAHAAHDYHSGIITFHVLIEHIYVYIFFLLIL